MATQKFLQAKKTKLSGSGVTATATSIGLNFFTTPDGTEITTSELGTTNYGTLEPGTSKEEIISFTGVTQNGDGTATLTGVTRGLGFTTPYTAVAGNRQSHAGNTVFVLSNNPQMYDDMSSNVNDETITGKFTFPGGGDADAPVSGTVYAEPTDDLEYASKKYIDDIAIAGSPKATEAVYGIAKLSSAAASPTEPVVLNNEEVSATSAANKVVKANASGKIATDFISDGTSSGLEAGAGAGTQVKVKTSGGILTGADGLYVDVGTTNGKIIQVTTGDKLPVVDGSNLTGVLPAIPTILQTTRVINASNGVVNLAHGLGRIPKFVKATAIYDINDTTHESVKSFGFSDGVNNYSVFSKGSAGDGSNWTMQAGSSSTYAVYILIGGGGSGEHFGEYAVITFDATNIIFTWTKDDTMTDPTRNIYIQLEVY